MVAHRNQLSILQYNTRKSRTVMIELFEKKRIYDIDIIAIQEPWRNPNKTSYHPLKDRFDIVYPYSEDSRVCFYINKRIPPGSWYPKYHSPDLCTLNIKSSNGRIIRIHNIYNPGAQEANELSRLYETLKYHRNSEQIMLGDFNLHHALWGGPGVKQDDGADELIMIAEEFAMEQLLPAGTVTYEENCQTTIDLIFSTPELTNGVIKCDTEKLFESGSDHLPILTSLELAMIDFAPEPRRNFNRVDSEKLREVLKNIIDSEECLSQQAEGPTLSNSEIDSQVVAMINALQTAITQSIPLSRISPRSKPGFTPECKEAQRRSNRLKRRWRSQLTEEAWNEYRMARNFKNNLIKRTAKSAFREFVAQACESPEARWKKTKWARKQLTKQACLPPLNDENGLEISEPETKANLLLKTFFPPPVQADLTDIDDNMTYPNAHVMRAITADEIRKAITQSPPKKAPGEDGIPNLILKEASAILLPHLH